MGRKGVGLGVRRVKGWLNGRERDKITDPQLNTEKNNPHKTELGEGKPDLTETV